jgi:hypothetical protein
LLDETADCYVSSCHAQLPAKRMFGVRESFDTSPCGDDALRRDEIEMNPDLLV